LCSAAAHLGLACEQESDDRDRRAENGHVERRAAVLVGEPDVCRSLVQDRLQYNETTAYPD
jgi:hypothetical protein